MMNTHKFTWVFTLTVAFGTPCLADDTIPEGLGSINYTPNPKEPAKSLTVWTSKPKDVTANAPIVFVMHGVKRNGKGYRDNWAKYSEQYKFMLVVPEFTEESYPSETYHQGNILDKGRLVEPNAWTFTVIERLFDHVKKTTGNKSEKYYLYGHSAGGQFVHRFVMFMPEARYAKAIAANPGFYTFPNQEATYPYGLKGTHIKKSILPASYGRNFVLLLGTADTDRNDPDLRKTKEADAQGLTRFERGNNYFKAAQAQAKLDKAKFEWKLETVPDVGHSDAKMSKSAAAILLAK